MVKILGIAAALVILGAPGLQWAQNTYGDHPPGDHPPHDKPDPSQFGGSFKSPFKKPKGDGSAVDRKPIGSGNPDTGSGADARKGKKGGSQLNGSAADRFKGKGSGKSKFLTANGKKFKKNPLPTVKQASSSSAPAPVYGGQQPGETVQKTGFAGTGGGALPEMKQASSSSATAPVYGGGPHIGDTIPKASFPAMGGGNNPPPPR